MTINGTVIRTYGNNAVIYNMEHLILVTNIPEQITPGNHIRAVGDWYEKHYLRHDFTDGYTKAFRVESVAIK